MSHITNPKVLRIFGIQDWLSRGFYKKKFPQYLEEDFKLRSFLTKKLAKGIIEDIEIERGGTGLKVLIKTSRPALIIGRGGEGIEKLRRAIERIVEEKDKKAVAKRNVKLEIISVKNPWSSASLCSQWIASQLEKRVPYRRVLKMALSKIVSIKEVGGARVQVAGRLNGINIARTEWLQEGRLPRGKARAVIDYGFSQAYCSYGVIGVKVWIYKGEHFNPL